MKMFFLLNMILVCATIHSQIPNATQEPKWFMRVFAEDAHGIKDTIFIGDDPSAQSGNGQAPYNDTQFGEIWSIPQPSNQFHFATYYWISPNDSILKVDINNYNSSNQLYYNLTFDSAYFPVTLKFELNKLRSDSLPYPNQYPGAPNAQLELYYGGIINVTYPGPCGLNGGPIIISDSISTNCDCCSKDSIVLADFFGSSYAQNQSINLYINPWTGNSPTAIKTLNPKNSYQLSPNPFSNFISVSISVELESTHETGTEHYVIYNFLGDVISSGKLNSNKQIETQELDSGIYLITILNENLVLQGTYKMIKI